jgi:hypothetical protein
VVVVTPAVSAGVKHSLTLPAACAYNGGMTTSCYCGRKFATARGQGVHQQKCPIAIAGNAAYTEALHAGRGGAEAAAALARAVEDAKGQS